MNIDTFEMPVSTLKQIETVCKFLIANDYQWDSSYFATNGGQIHGCLTLTHQGLFGAEYPDRPRILFAAEFPQHEPFITYEAFCDRYIVPPKDAGNIFNVNAALLSPINRG